MHLLDVDKQNSPFSTLMAENIATYLLLLTMEGWPDAWASVDWISAEPVHPSMRPDDNRERRSLSWLMLPTLLATYHYTKQPANCYKN